MLPALPFGPDVEGADRLPAGDPACHANINNILPLQVLGELISRYAASRGWFLPCNNIKNVLPLQVLRKQIAAASWGWLSPNNSKNTVLLLQVLRGRISR